MNTPQNIFIVLDTLRTCLNKCWSDDVFTLLLQESGSEGAGVRGGPDEDAGRGSAAEAAAHRGGGPAVEGETGTLRLLRGTGRFHLLLCSEHPEHAALIIQSFRKHF